MSIGHFFAYLSAISLLASTKKGTEKKIVKKDHVLLFHFTNLTKKKTGFSPTFGGLQFVNKIFISFLRNKKRK